MYGIEAPKLNAKNSHFGNKYSTLDEILRVVTPFLRKEKKDLVQTVQVADGNLLFVTQIVNEDGTIARQVAFPFDAGKAGPQAVGSAITYARRYGLLLCFNLIGEEDDDGERAEGRGEKKKPARKRTTKKKLPPYDPVGKNDDTPDEFGF